MTVPPFSARRFLIAGAFCLALGIFQGIIQVWPSTSRWLEDAGYYGYLISPLAHARLNILGGILLLLMGFVYHAALPIFGSRPGRRLAGASFGLVLAGALTHYLVLLIWGIERQAIFPLFLTLTAVIQGAGMALFGGWLITRSLRTPPANLEHGWLGKFLAVAGGAFVVGAVHGTIQSLPAAWEWLRAAAYGGHLVAHLGYGHILVVGGGTFCLAALTYYSLSRSGRPIYSRNLAEISFWFSLVGVSFFYLSLVGLGLAEGRLVHQGLSYDQAKETMAGIHKALLMEGGIILGVGYWTFAANVLLSLRRGRSLSFEQTASQLGALKEQGRPRPGFVFLTTASIIAFLLGTIQGVFQVIPYFADWLKAAGPAGEMIDPLAHAHINMLGGVLTLLASVTYALLPEAAGRPLPNDRATRISPYLLVGGTAAFYLAALSLGIWEGLLVTGGLTYLEAREFVGIRHSLALAGAGIIMALGALLFLANLLRSILAAPRSPALMLDLSDFMTDFLAASEAIPAGSPAVVSSRLGRGSAVWMVIVLSGCLFVVFPVTAALIFLSE